MNLFDKMRKKLKINKNGILFLLGIAAIGFISGVIFITIISKSDQTLVKEYINDYFNNINKINYLDVFKNTFLESLSFIIIVWLLGMSVIGIPINVFYYFIKSFIIGFSISSFILTYKIKGCLYAFLYIVPHNIINLIIYTILIYFTINFSLTLIYAIFKKKNINFKIIMNKYVNILFLSLGLILITSIYETFVVPNLIKLF
ncbi:MAG: stage II sporulation protein M [Bacilli bacterium]|nr:stage II sporulation protein M [Bacilli bacterium]